MSGNSSVAELSTCRIQEAIVGVQFRSGIAKEVGNVAARNPRRSVGSKAGRHFVTPSLLVESIENIKSFGR